MKSGGGWKSIVYTLKKAKEAGGLRRMWQSLRSRNACKTCALGMGGQRGGMVNEQGRFPSVCKKSIQAMAADMQPGIQESFFQNYGFDRLRNFSSRELESAGRLAQPIYAGPTDTHYRAITWDDAFQRIVHQLKESSPDDTFFYFSGRSSNEAGFLVQLFARLYGTNNVNNCSYYCHQASGVGLSSTLGSGTATVELEDVENCDLLFIIGANPASNHPRLIHSLIKMKRRGGKVIVINPIKEIGLVRFRVPSDPLSLLFGSKVADEYIQLHIGGDIAFLSGVGKALLERDNVENSFIESATDGWNQWAQTLQEASWDEIVEQSGVDRPTIHRVAEMYADSSHAIFSWAMGVTHHEHGVQTVQAIANLALMRGMVGKPRAGLLPIRGHSNVQGIGSMGVTPKLKDAVFNRLQEKFQVQLPTSKGLDTLSCIEQAEQRGIRFAMCLGGNLYGSNPDSTFAERAFQNMDMLLYLSTTLNTGHIRGRGKETIILPVRARDEEPQATTQESMFNYVRLSDGGPSRIVGPRSEVEVIARIAREVLGESSPVNWKSMEVHKHVREAISEIIPGYEAVGKIDETKMEFQIAGRTYHTPQFNTPSKRAQFHPVSLPRLQTAHADQFRLMTIRSEGQFNTVVYEEEDVYRGQERRDVILMNPVDRQRLGLELNQQVAIQSKIGVMANILVREIDIHPGNVVMYYPEANVLIPRSADPASRTPAFKNTYVRIVP